MDLAKSRQLKKDLAAQPEPQIVLAARFFDGNDDLGSIGCNLPDHPGIDLFRSILLGLLNRSDVQGVYAQISELDPGDDSWPFTDTVIVKGSISAKDLQMVLAPLQPDEVGGAEEFGMAISDDLRSLVAWWD